MLLEPVQLDLGKKSEIMKGAMQPMVDLKIWTTKGDRSEDYISMGQTTMAFDKDKFDVKISERQVKKEQRKPKQPVRSNSRQLAIAEGRVFDEDRFKFNGSKITRTELREIKTKSADPRNAIIFEVARLALVLKDAQDYI